MLPALAVVVVAAGGCGPSVRGLDDAVDAASSLVDQGASDVEIALEGTTLCSPTDAFEGYEVTGATVRGVLDGTTTSERFAVEGRLGSRPTVDGVEVTVPEMICG